MRGLISLMETPLFLAVVGKTQKEPEVQIFRFINWKPRIILNIVMRTYWRKHGASHSYKK